MDAGIPLINGLPQFPSQIGPVNVQGDITATGNITAGGQLAGASGNITGNLTVGGNVTVTGTISASGLSDSQARNARAPRQGLVYDGTTNSSGTLASAIGTSDFTASVLFQMPPSSSAKAIFSIGSFGGARSFNVYVDTGVFNFVIFGATGADYSNSVIAGVDSYAGKYVFLTLTRVGSTLTAYINGVATAFTGTGGAGTQPTFAGTITSTTVNHGGMPNFYFIGFVGSLYLYNRALSAGEIQSLYDAGAPSAADYNTASNTAINTSACIDGNYGAGFTGASATGFTASAASGSKFALAQPYSAVSPNQRFRVSGTLTLNAGKTIIPTVDIAGSSYVSLTSGAFSVELVSTVYSAGTSVVFRTTGDANYTISGLSITRLGLLLAPEIPAPGNGLLWNDKSGNGATIVLPTSGISWNLPSNAENRVRAQTNTNGNQQLLGATCLPPYVQITRVRARSLSGTPNVKLGTTSGGNDIVTTVALSTSWKTLALNLTDPTGSSNTNLWANSNSTDMLQWDISWEPIAAL